MSAYADNAAMLHSQCYSTDNNILTIRQTFCGWVAILLRQACVNEIEMRNDLKNKSENKELWKTIFNKKLNTGKVKVQLIFSFCWAKKMLKMIKNRPIWTQHYRLSFNTVYFMCWIHNSEYCFCLHLNQCLGKRERHFAKNETPPLPSWHIFSPRLIHVALLGFVCAEVPQMRSPSAAITETPILLRSLPCKHMSSGEHTAHWCNSCRLGGSREIMSRIDHCDGSHTTVGARAPPHHWWRPPCLPSPTEGHPAANEDTNTVNYIDHLSLTRYFIYGPAWKTISIPLL